MVTRLVMCLLVVLWLHSATGAQFQNCGTARNLVEGYDDPYLYCYVNSTSTVRWIGVSKSGDTSTLGTCYGRNNCKRTSGVYLRHSGLYIRIRVNNVNYTNISCQETFTNGTFHSDTCQLNLTRVSFLNARQFDVLESGSGSVYCYNSPYTPCTVTWTLTTESGQTLDLGTCTAVGSCTSPNSPGFTLRRTREYYSYISIQNIARNKGGQLTCSFTYSGYRETDIIPFNIYNPAIVSNCHAELLPHNWSAILSCDVSNVFSSAGDYDFTIHETFQVLKHSNLAAANSHVFEGRRSYRAMLTPYTNSTNNKVYYRGRLVHSWPLSPLQGRYTQLTAYVYYGYTGFGTSVDFAVNITTPSQPTHNCSDVIYIPETGVVPCVCTADSLGSPPGRLLWLLGNTTIATGDYNVSQLQFPSGQVSREHAGMGVRCLVDWIQPIGPAFTRHVIYSDQGSAKTYQPEAIGLGIGLGVVVLVVFIVIIVLIVLYRRGLLCQRGEQHGRRPKPQDDEDSHDYTSLDLSQVASNQRNGVRQGVSCPPAVYQGEDNRVYENTESHGGHM